MNARHIVKELCPPLIWSGLRRMRRAARTFRSNGSHIVEPEAQQLELYWTPELAAALETWGAGNAWSEIQLLLCTRRGRVLDIACGTGKVMELNSRFKDLELHGCDISDFLIGKARERGLPAESLRVCDATNTGYAEGAFQYSYSIGSLEHFTEAGIDSFLAEAKRITQFSSFHHIPTARDGRNHGWITPYQSYFNNSIEWWLPRFTKAFPVVHVLESTWSDDESVGSWFICFNGDSGNL